MTGRPRRARPRGRGASASVRFDPYYRLQTYDARQLAWREVRGRYETAEEARAAAPAGRRWRVMKIAMDGRTIEEG